MPSLASYSVSHHKKQTSKSQLLRNNRAFFKLGVLCSAGCQSVIPGVLSALHDLRDSSTASLPGSEPLLESHANFWGHNAPSKSNPLRVPTSHSIAANAFSLASNAELGSPRISPTDLEITASCHSPFPALRRWKTLHNIPATAQRDTCSSAACESTNCNNAQIQGYQGTTSQGVTSPEAGPAMNYLFSSSSSSNSSPPSGLRAPPPSPVQNYGEPSSPRQPTSFNTYVQTQYANTSQRTLTQPTTTWTNTQRNQLPLNNSPLPVNSRHIHMTSRVAHPPAYSSALQALIDRKLNSSADASAPRNHNNHSTQVPAVHRSAGSSEQLINKLTNGKRHAHRSTTPYSRPPQRPQERDTLLLNSYPRSMPNSTTVSTQTWWPSTMPSTTSTKSSHKTKNVAPPPYGWAPHVLPSKPPPQKRLALYEPIPRLSEPYPRENAPTDLQSSQSSTAL